MNGKHKIIRLVSVTFQVMLASLMFQSCFTGIEHTGHIALSKHDHEITHRISLEEEFMSDIHGLPLSQWTSGRKFAFDESRAAMAFDIPPAPDAGNILSYVRFENNITPGGTNRICLIFRDKHGRLHSYATAKSDTSKVVSTELPLLIDATLVGRLAEKLRGKKLWTRNSEWLTADGEPLRGLKFEEITVTDVRCGTENLPYLIEFRTSNDNLGYMYMSHNTGTLASRPFHTLFLLENPRKKFSNISEENWERIRNGHVALGMTKTECRLALGAPTESESGRDYSKTIDIWTYDNGIYLRFEDGLLVNFRK